MKISGISNFTMSMSGSLNSELIELISENATCTVKDVSVISVTSIYEIDLSTSKSLTPSISKLTASSNLNVLSDLLASVVFSGTGVTPKGKGRNGLENWILNLLSGDMLSLLTFIGSGGSSSISMLMLMLCLLVLVYFPVLLDDYSSSPVITTPENVEISAASSL